MARRAQRKRIGYGPFDFNDNKNSQAWLRNKFLEAIQKLEPEQKRKPLGDLAAKPFEEYVKYCEKQDEKSISRRQKVDKRVENQSGRQSYFNALNKNNPLRKSIWQWGEKYHLNSPWCYELAFTTLNHWHRFSGASRAQFQSLPHYAHPKYLGFGSIKMIYDMTRMPYGSLNEGQKKYVDDFSEEDKQFMEFFNEQQRIYLSFYPHDPHIWDDNHFELQANRLIENALPSMTELIEKALPPVNSALPVLNLLDEFDRADLQNILCRRLEELFNIRRKELLNRINECAEKDSVQPLEFGDDVNTRLEWAARFQVFNESYNSIGKGKHSNVLARVNELLDLIDLDRRPTTKGRQPAL
jgi:hypothetical protein